MQQWIGLEGYTYANFMRRCVAPELQQGICVKGEYGWLGSIFCKSAGTGYHDSLWEHRKKDAGTFSLTRRLRNLCLSNIL